MLFCAGFGAQLAIGLQQVGSDGFALAVIERNGAWLLRDAEFAKLVASLVSYRR